MSNARKTIKFLACIVLPILVISFLSVGSFLRLPPPISGYTEVNVSVGENGESVVNIPLALPKGTILAPELGIGYSSQASNGLLGKGFQLEGLYSITRTGANKAQDGFFDGLDFDNLDRFSLNGERLVVIDGSTYGGNNTEYRTEQNNFSRIRSYGSAGSGPASFKVWTKSGLIMEFGNTTDSRIEAQGKTEAYTWMVNKISDTKGNYINFSYIEDAVNGEFRIDKIEYTGNTNTGQLPYNLIQFTYESRPDVTTAYLVGSKMSASKRLQEILVKDNGVQYRRYVLEYFPSTDLGLGNQSFLKSIKEYGVGNVAFEPTTFKWTNRNVFATQETPYTTTNVNTAFSNQPDRIRVGDVTGDGKMDMVLGPDQTTGNWYVMRSTENGFVNETWATNTPTSWRNMDQAAIRLMDVNSDGLLDVCVGPDAAGKWEIMKNTGSSFGSVEPWCTNAYGNYHNYNGLREIYPMDANGDGRQDFIIGLDARPFGGNYGKMYFLRNTGTSFVDDGAWITSPHGGWAQYPANIHPMDVNGDGLGDFVLGPGTDGKWWVLKNTGSGLTDDSFWATNAYNAWANLTDRIHQMDFDGDGLEDFVLGPEQNTGNWYCLRNTGSSFVDIGQVGTNLYKDWWDKPTRVKMQDLNGDGLTDFLFQPFNATDEWRCMFNNGKSFELGYDNGYWLYDAYESWWDKPNLNRQIDVNGDGVLDICFGPEPTTGKWEVMTNRISQNHPLLLESVTNGHGATTELVYEELTRSDVYTKGTGATFPKMDFIAPLYVVSEVRTDNGIGGQNSIFYKYYDAKLDLSGRGFRGFGKTEQIDSLRGTKNVVIYERQHQYLSTKVSGNEQWLLSYNGAPKLLHSVETVLDTFEYFNKTVHFSYVKSSTEKSYDLNSPDPIQTKITSSIYDRDWGDVTQMTEETKIGSTPQYTVVTDNTYAAPNTAGDNWILGRLTLASVSKTLAGKSTIAKQSTFAYQAVSGLLVQEILNATSNTLKVQKDYTLDAYGNHLTETVSGPNITARTTTFTYDAKNRLVVKVQNALNQEVNYAYQDGLPYSTTDPNGLTETIDRDPFGRPMTTFYPDGTQSTTSYYKCDGTQTDAPPQYAVHFTESEKAGNGKSRVYYDILDREIRRVDYGLNGQLFFADTEYDEKGLVKRKSEPYRDSATWHTFQYDATYRVLRDTAPGNLISAVQYAGLTTISTNAQGQNATRITNAMGWLIQSKDHLNNIVNYDYDSDGNMTTVTDPVGNVTKMDYDPRGNKTRMEDPDLGLLTYEYNTLGLLTKQTYYNGQNITITYDLLNRKTQQVEKKNATDIERTLNWTYDTGNKGIGKLSSDIINGVVSKQYLYDNYGRVIEEKEKIENVDYSTTYQYDTYGRIQFLNYPGVTDFRLRYDYDTYGHLKSICQPNTTNGNCATTFWKIDSLNNRGQAIKMTLGNGLVTRKAYDRNTGFLNTIQTNNADNSVQIQNLSYQFSALGNLTQRKDVKNNLTEDFQYDNLNRLTQSQVGGQTAVTVQYNAIGNIIFKSNVGTYSYGADGVGPHKVSSIDHTGIPNCFYGFHGTLEYSVYNYALKITDNTDNITFTYDANRAKQTQYLVKNNVLQFKKHYINSLAERIEEGGVVKTLLHIKAMGETVAVLKKQAGAPDTLRYMHYDHLGSLQSMSRADGTLENTFSYDAWGKPRFALTWMPLQTVAPLPPFHRGFTMHEMMGIEDLVHMNARLYDPATGRFLSADPTVQFPDNLQSLNRYSYVLNNPLSFTDPTGFGIWKSIKKFIGAIVSIAVAIITAPIGGLALFGSLGAFWGTVASGAAAGFAGGFVGTLANGGSVGAAFRSGLIGGAIGGLSAGLTYGVGEVFKHTTSFIKHGIEATVSKALVHGVVQGSMNALGGGKFAAGFAAGFFATIANGAMNDFGGGLSGGTKFIMSAVVGGTASKISGGSFANGAMAAAFVSLYNEINMGVKDFNKGNLLANANSKDTQDVHLDDELFSKIVNKAEDLGYNQNRLSELCGVKAKCNLSIDFYGTDFENSIGTGAIVYMKEGNNYSAVKFFDSWDFDWKPWGERNTWGEIKTRGASIIYLNAKSFKVYH